MVKSLGFHREITRNFWGILGPTAGLIKQIDIVSNYFDSDLLLAQMACLSVDNAWSVIVKNFSF